MKDYIVRATAADSQVRAFAAVTRETVETARKAHNTSPVATAALGRLLTAGAMMGVMMKGEKDILTLQIKADGPINGITVTADSQGRVKGYVENPEVILPANEKGKLDVSGAVGNGFLNVIKDMGLKEPYSGTAEFHGEIAEDLTYYFAVSEQVPSAVGLGVLMNKDNTVQQAGRIYCAGYAFCRRKDHCKVGGEYPEDPVSYYTSGAGPYTGESLRRCLKDSRWRSWIRFRQSFTVTAARSVWKKL